MIHGHLASYTTAETHALDSLFSSPHHSGCERSRYWSQVCHCRALAVQVQQSTRASVLVDVLTVYGAAGKAMIFTQTRRDADEVAAGVAKVLPCEVFTLTLDWIWIHFDWDKFQISLNFDFKSTWIQIHNTQYSGQAMMFGMLRIWPVLAIVIQIAPHD